MVYTSEPIYSIFRAFDRSQSGALFDRENISFAAMYHYLETSYKLAAFFIPENHINLVSSASHALCQDKTTKRTPHSAHTRLPILFAWFPVRYISVGVRAVIRGTLRVANLGHLNARHTHRNASPRERARLSALLSITRLCVGVFFRCRTDLSDFRRSRLLRDFCLPCRLC